MTDVQQVGRNGHLRWLLGVLTVIAALSLLKLQNGFVIDDRSLIVDAEVIRDPANWWAIVTNNAMYAAGKAGGVVDTWRPITMLTFVWDWQISADSPWSYHVTNLIAHLGCVALAFALARRLLGRTHVVAASFAALAFGIHPLTAEAHVWINGRSDVFGTLFALGAVLMLSRGSDDGPVRSSVPRLAFAALLFLAGCLCKEVVLLLFPVFFLLDPVLYRARWTGVPVRDWLWAALRLVPFGVVAATYLVARTLILDGARVGTSEAATTALRNLGLLWMEGLRGYVAPTTTAMRLLHDEWVGLPSGVFVGAWTAAIAILIAAWAGKRLLPSALVAVVAIYATLLPVAVITADTWPGFGRYLYPAAPFAFIALAETAIAATAALAASGRDFATSASRVLAGAWMFALALLYVATIRTYSDMETLAHAMIEESPRSSHGWASLGHQRFAAEDYPAAAVALSRAVELSPDKRGLWLDLGLARVFAGDNAGALEVAERGANQDDGPGDFYNIAAMALMNTDVPGAAQALLGCLSREPGHQACLGNVARLTSVHPRAAEYRAAIDQLLAQPQFAGVAPQLATLRQGTPP